MDAVTLAAAKSYVKRTFRPSTRVSTLAFWRKWTPTGTNAIAARTMVATPDMTDGTLFYSTSGSNIWRGSLPGITIGGGSLWTACSLPTSVTSGAKITDLLYFKGKVFITGVEDGGTNKMAVWVADPPVGSGSLTWTKVLDGGAGSASYRSSLCVVRDGFGNTGTDVALIVSEYGDPTSTGPRVYRTTIVPTGSGDWTTVSPFPVALANMRHVHCVFADTYAAAGTVYLTAGDGVTHTIMKSTDGGATFIDDLTDSNGQAVQISATPNYLWFAGDSMKGSVLVKRRSDSQYMWASTRPHQQLGIEPESYSDGVLSADGLTLTSVSMQNQHFQEVAYTPADVGIELRADPTVFRPVTTISAVTTAGQTLSTGAIGTLTSVTLSVAALSGVRGTSNISFSVMRSHRHKWKQNAFFGCAYYDPTTGRESFYSVAANDQVGGDHSALFWLPEAGGDIQVVDHLWGQSGAFGRVFVYGGNVYCATIIHPVAAAA